MMDAQKLNSHWLTLKDWDRIVFQPCKKFKIAELPWGWESCSILPTKFETWLKTGIHPTGPNIMWEAHPIRQLFVHEHHLQVNQLYVINVSFTSNVLTHSPSTTPHILTVSSSHALAKYRLSGEKQTAWIQPQWPSKTCNNFPLRGFHSLIVLSQDPEACKLNTSQNYKVTRKSSCGNARGIPPAV